MECFIYITVDLNISRVLEEIFSKVDHHIQNDDVMSKLNISALPSLCDQLIRLIEYLVNTY